VNDRRRSGHILTVSVEDYFQSHDLAAQVRFKQWDRLEPRIEGEVAVTLERLARHKVHATFFVSGWTAERHPTLVPTIVAGGHEVASAGYSPRRSARATPDAFRKDLRLARGLLEAQGANRIHGYRASHWLETRDLWMLDVLAEEGYRYDASVNPLLRRYPDRPELARASELHGLEGGRTLWEFPVSTLGLLGLRVPITGGNYVRQLPHTLLKQAVSWWNDHEDSPLVFYFMPWELDGEQPRFDLVPRLTALRHYRNLTKTAWVLDDYLRRYDFHSVAEHLGLDLTPRPATPSATHEHGPAEEPPLPRVPSPYPGVTSVTIVVPVFNEALNIAFLRATLLRLRERLADRYRIEVIVVDDGSTDDTVERVKTLFADVADFKLLEHGHNRGIAGAMMTGIRAAASELVCTIDCDCSYDPDILEHMLPMALDADLVTASPYHPDGHALNVPRWRLALSQNLSRAYRQLVDAQLHTFTSCCRVHRKSVFAPMELEHEDFLGVAEMLLRAGMDGRRVVEFPATLESRLFGQSKMQTARVIRGHLGLLRELAVKRFGAAAAGGS
jgi:polysaccharide deacetylase family protein (PEP-CTERM system associated)